MVFRSDPCGFTCLIMTYGAVLYADYVVVRWIVLQTMSDSLWGAFNALLFNTVIFLLLWAHARDQEASVMLRILSYINKTDEKKSDKSQISYD